MFCFALSIAIIDAGHHSADPVLVGERQRHAEQDESAEQEVVRLSTSLTGPHERTYVDHPDGHGEGTSDLASRK
jgi:hypothetical protein